MQIKIKQAKSFEDAQKIAFLAKIIWTEHYTPIIGKEQVDYMLKNYQSADKIYADMQKGHLYFIASLDNSACGYCGYVRQGDRVFLSKIYIEKRARGFGIARKFFETVRAFAKENRCREIYLTVNKHNSGSTACYKRLGFTICDEMVTDIGGGFVMDDYKMRFMLEGEKI